MYSDLLSLCWYVLFYVSENDDLLNSTMCYTFVGEQKEEKGLTLYLLHTPYGKVGTHCVISECRHLYPKYRL